jgi:uncharacterized membrane protein YeiH
VNWEWLNIFGTFSFAISGSIVAMEEDYDILGAMCWGWLPPSAVGLIKLINWQEKYQPWLNWLLYLFFRTGKGFFIRSCGFSIRTGKEGIN